MITDSLLHKLDVFWRRFEKHAEQQAARFDALIDVGERTVALLEELGDVHRRLQPSSGADEKWADDVHPCGPWEISPDGWSVRYATRSQFPPFMAAWAHNAPGYRFRWCVELKSRWTACGVVDTLSEAKAAADRRLRGES